MKILFGKSDGRVLGAQAVGEDGVDKRISDLALAIQLGATVYDLEQVDLCYSPPFGNEKDPINFAGMVASDVLRGDMPITQSNPQKTVLLLDVREKAELAVEHVPGAVNIPLGQLRSRLDELPLDREIGVICRSGQHTYARDAASRAERIRRQSHLWRHAVAYDPLVDVRRRYPELDHRNLR